MAHKAGSKDDWATRGRWLLAGTLHRFPEFRGRDRLKKLLIGRRPLPDWALEGTFGPGLKYELDTADDMSVRGLFFLQYQAPALAPVLEAALRPDGTFFDVGAHIGVYSMWASRLVGERGTVFAFEAAPSTGKRLLRTIRLNGIGNIQVVLKAVAEESGTLQFGAVPHATGLASARPAESGLDVELVTVESTSLDDHLAATGCRVPQLVKIDVEGYEFPVLRGARGMLSGFESPVVVFESDSDSFRDGQAQFGDIVRWLEDEVGYQVFSMLPRGLIRVGLEAREPMSGNSLAARPDRHGSVLQRLGRHRFRRNQTW